MAQLSHYQELLQEHYGDRQWVVAFDQAVAASGVAQKLRSLGANNSFLLAASRGTGTIDPQFPSEILDIRAASMMEGIRKSEAAMQNLGAGALASLDAFDPHKQARVLLPLFGRLPEVAGRKVFGARPNSWLALEDKTCIDDWWGRWDVAHQSVEVVPLADAWAAHKRIGNHNPLGTGTVWAADNRDGWHGGATGTRWVVEEHEAKDALAYFAGCADRVRVMPFLEGIPCSIQGFVLPDHVVVLRPCEMIVLRETDSRRFLYAAASSFWDPADNHRSAMRLLARKVGEGLRRDFSYRGGFTVDGVITGDGFFPTELNPRIGASLHVMSSGIPGGFPFYLMNQVLVEGENIDPQVWQAQRLESLLLEALDQHRGARCSVVSPVITEERQEVYIAITAKEGREFQVSAVPSAELADAKVSWGPATAGSYLSSEILRMPVGESIGSRAAAIIDWANQRWRLGLPAVYPAPMEER